MCVAEPAEEGLLALSVAVMVQRVLPRYLTGLVRLVMLMFRGPKRESSMVLAVME